MRIGGSRGKWWRVALSFAAAIVFIFSLKHSERLTHSRTREDDSPRSGSDYSLVSPEGTASFIPAELTSGTADDVDDVCDQASAMVAYVQASGEVRSAPTEPEGAGLERLSTWCANRLVSPVGQVVTRMRAEARVGDLGVQRRLIEKALQQDSEDVDAYNANLPPDDVASVHAYYAGDVAELRRFALRPDPEAAMWMAKLAEDGKLVDQSSIEAAAWRVFARCSAQKSIPADEELLRDPALDELGNDDSVAAINLAKTLYSDMRLARH